MRSLDEIRDEKSLQLGRDYRDGKLSRRDFRLRMNGMGYPSDATDDYLENLDDQLKAAVSGGT